MDSFSNITIRQELDGDKDFVFQVNKLAFNQENEARLVDSLRQSKAMILSLVACLDDKVVGHIMYSEAFIESRNEQYSVLALAPMAVSPKYHRMGIGSMLIERSVQMLKDLNHRAVIVLGHAAYYPRFGFRVAKDFGVYSEFDVPEDVFMVLELYDDALKEIRGKVKYDVSFHSL